MRTYSGLCRCDDAGRGRCFLKKLLKSRGGRTQGQSIKFCTKQSKIRGHLMLKDIQTGARQTRALRPFGATARAGEATAPPGLDPDMPRRPAPLALLPGREFLPMSEDFPCKTAAPKERVHPERSEGPRQPGLAPTGRPGRADGTSFDWPRQLNESTRF